MIFGWSGQILRIDLSKKEFSKGNVTPYTRLFIGGRGFSVKIVYDEVDPQITPFDPMNKILLGPGVLAGTPAPSSSRMKLTTMSPNGLLTSSGIGAFVGAEIKHAGYDNIIIQGKSDSPVYLFINNNDVEFRDASHIWGKSPKETETVENIIKKEIGDPDVQVMWIGLAGENLVHFACVRTGWFSAAGRGGLGAIMGSKNLKAIAVRGRRGIKVANLEGFLRVCLETRNALIENEDMKGKTEKGDRYHTASHVRNNQNFGNWEDVDSEEIESALDPNGCEHRGEEFWSHYSVGKVGCFGCPVYHFEACDVPGIGVGAPKCFAWLAFSGGIWNNDYKLMFHAASLCNQYGLDFISTGNIIGFLMELYHKGIITAKDTDGIPFERGGKNAILFAIHKIAEQEGFGKLFRKGVLDAARKIGKGAEECAMQVKELEMHPDEDRAFHGYALGKAVVGKDDIEALSAEQGWFGNKEKMEQWAIDLVGAKEAAYPPSYEKSRIVWDCENRSIVGDMLGVCRRIIPWYFSPSLEIPARLFSSATGIDISENELLIAAQRVRTLERAFNVLRGIRRKDDSLPKRIFETEVPYGPFRGERLEKEKFEKMVDEFYALCGWDEDGIPKKETFEKFALLPEWQAFEKKMRRKGGTNG